MSTNSNQPIVDRWDVLSQRNGPAIADPDANFQEYVQPIENGGADVWLMLDDTLNPFNLVVTDRELAGLILKHGFRTALDMANWSGLIRFVRHTFTIVDEAGSPEKDPTTGELQTAQQIHICLEPWNDKPQEGPTPKAGWLRLRNDVREHAARLASPEVPNVFLMYNGMEDNVLTIGLYPGTYNAEKMAKRATATA